MKRACLIEFNNYHEECLYSQLRFLKESGYWICLIIHPQLKMRVLDYDALIDECIEVEVGSKVFFLKRLRLIIKLKSAIAKMNIETVIFNTASSKKEVIALSFLLRKRFLFGVVHNLKKLSSSFSQKIISRYVKNYFVLNDTLLANANELEIVSNFESFYPVFFPEYSAKLSKDQTEKWLVIPGKIEFKRRDYLMALKALSSLKPEKRPKLILLGKLNKTNPDHLILRTYIQEHNLNDHVITFENYIENAVFHTYLKKCDVIFLPVKQMESQYFGNKIMGAFNLAFAYRKRLIGPKMFEVFEDLRFNGDFYDDFEDLKKIISLELMSKYKINNTKDSMKWDFEYQRKKYIAFIENR